MKAIVVNDSFLRSLTARLIGVLGISSGFRKELHEATGRGAWDTMLFGCMSMFLSGQRLDADYLCNVALTDIESTFGIPLSVDKIVNGGPVRFEQNFNI